MGWSRTKLVQVDTSILSSYQRGGGTGGARDTLLPLWKLGNAALVPQDVADALLEAHQVVTAEGGDFRVTDLRRDVEVQAAARKKYENWLAAGKPSTRSAQWDSSTMKNAVVARPGYSYHNAGRAVDLHVAALNFPLLRADMQLDKLWELLIPMGWTPIIQTAEETESEAWHFDFRGEWEPVYDRLGYKDGAMCAALDIGIDCYARWQWRFVQAQLQRAGYDLGEVDGFAGKATKGALRAAGILWETRPGDLRDQVSALPSSAKVLWRA